MRVEFWSDFACPFCYIGEANLRAAIAMLPEHGCGEPVELEMHAFELHPDAGREVLGSTVERFAGKYCMSYERAAERVDEITQIGREAGLAFDYAGAQVASTFDAHRLAKLCRKRLGHEAAESLRMRLFDACFGQGRLLADPEVLVELGVDAGLAEADVRAMLAGEAQADEVRADERDAKRLGIHAIPHFIIDGEREIPGCMLPEGYLAALLK